VTAPRVRVSTRSSAQAAGRLGLYSVESARSIWAAAGAGSDPRARPGCTPTGGSHPEIPTVLPWFPRTQGWPRAPYPALPAPAARPGRPPGSPIREPPRPDQRRRRRPSHPHRQLFTPVVQRHAQRRHARGMETRASSVISGTMRVSCGTVRWLRNVPLASTASTGGPTRTPSQPGARAPSQYRARTSPDTRTDRPP